MAQTIEQLTTVGLELMLSIEYGNGTRLIFWAGEPVGEDGEQIAPIGNKCVSMGIDGAQFLFNDTMALDVMRGMARSLWHISSWRERLRMVYEVIAVLVK